MSLSFSLDDAQKDFLARQAELAIASVLDNDPQARPLLPDPECSQSEHGFTLNRKLGSFVTLTQRGNLRGCIGTIIGQEPLYLNVWNMARAAAFNDPRFPPLRASEWPAVDMEISVLDSPSRCPDPQEIVIGRDGLILSYQGRNGVFLAQVPVEQGRDVGQYLENL
ncbi:MAG: AmmeMemoRadiSam system protein A, partial [Desulfovibrio sp.]|nr:AmmeMemoRadiSam system protein A [Desulfovibrio sp.]